MIDGGIHDVLEGHDVRLGEVARPDEGDAGARDVLRVGVVPLALVAVGLVGLGKTEEFAVANDRCRGEVKLLADALDAQAIQRQLLDSRLGFLRNLTLGAAADATGGEIVFAANLPDGRVRSSVLQGDFPKGDVWVRHVRKEGGVIEQTVLLRGVGHCVR